MPTSRELLSTVLQRLAHDERPLPAPDLVTTGYPSLDRLLAGGLRQGELTVLGGDAGSGKTALGPRHRDSCGRGGLPGADPHA